MAEGSPIGISGSQVGIHGNDMHTLALQGIQICWQCGDEGLPLSCSHLRNFAFMQDDAPYLQLSFVVSLKAYLEAM